MSRSCPTLLHRGNRCLAPGSDVPAGQQPPRSEPATAFQPMRVALSGTMTTSATPDRHRQPLVRFRTPNLVDAREPPVRKRAAHAGGSPPAPHECPLPSGERRRFMDPAFGRTARYRSRSDTASGIAWLRGPPWTPRRNHCPNLGEIPVDCVSLRVFSHELPWSGGAICGTHSSGMMYARCRRHAM